MEFVFKIVFKIVSPFVFKIVSPFVFKIVSPFVIEYVYYTVFAYVTQVEFSTAHRRHYTVVNTILSSENLRISSTLSRGSCKYRAP